MAGDWLKVEIATPDKPEVFMIAERLKISPAEAFGRLFLVWRWFNQHTIDGNALAVTYSHIDHIAGVTGMGEAMRDVRWLTFADDNLVGVKLPNFDRHNGKPAKERALTAKRVAEHKKRIANDSLTVGALPREEKRRDIKPRAAMPPKGEANPRWWETQEATLARARELQISTIGESWDALKRAIRDKEAGGKAA